jgi:DNA-binding transcriptional regulator YiaG
MQEYLLAKQRCRAILTSEVLMSATSLKPPSRSTRVARAKQKIVSSGYPEETPLRELREALRLPRPIFARLMACSERALANWESGRPLPEIYKSRLGELQNLYNGLFEAVEPTTIGSWLTAPNHEFDGLKPLELIERGESFRIWQMIFRLKPGSQS